jgi:hypothetical protein
MNTINFSKNNSPGETSTINCACFPTFHATQLNKYIYDLDFSLSELFWPWELFLWSHKAMSYLQEESALSRCGCDNKKWLGRMHTNICIMGKTEINHSTSTGISYLITKNLYCEWNAHNV